MTSEQMREAQEETRFREAHHWHTRLYGELATDQDWLDFAAWLETDDRNSDAYHKVANLDAFIADHPDNMKEEWQTGEKSSPDTTQTVDIQSSAKFFSHGRKYLASIVAVAATFLFVAIGSTYFNAEPPSIQEYATGLSGPRLVTLSDGSKIHLNVNSKVEVSFDEKERRTSLSYGEALFDVAKNPARPFLVNVGESRIRVLGTVFNVLQHNGNTEVTVSHGIVAVDAAAHEAGTDIFSSQRLIAGEQLRRKEGSTQADVSTVDIDATLAWREGRLVYDRAPLSEIAADLNRYFETPIELNKMVRTYSFSGALKTDDLDTILLLLEDSLQLSVIRTGSHIIINPS